MNLENLNSNLQWNAQKVSKHSFRTDITHIPESSYGPPVCWLFTNNGELWNSVCTHRSVCPFYLHGAVAEELLDVFGHTRSGHALGVGATDVTVRQPGGGSGGETGLKPTIQFTSEAGREVIRLTVRSPGRWTAPPASVPRPPAVPTDPEHTPCSRRTSRWPPSPPGAVVGIITVSACHLTETYTQQPCSRLDDKSVSNVYRTWRMMFRFKDTYSWAKLYVQFYHKTNASQTH